MEKPCNSYAPLFFWTIFNDNASCSSFSRYATSVQPETSVGFAPEILGSIRSQHRLCSRYKMTLFAIGRILYTAFVHAGDPARPPPPPCHTAFPSMVLANRRSPLRLDLNHSLPSARTERATIYKPIRLRSDIICSLSAVTISPAEQSLSRVFTQSQKILVLRSFF